MRPRARILLVDDEVSLAKALARWLRRHGHEVTVAHDGAQAHAVEGIFDCGVFAFDLPDTTGPELAEQLLDAVAVRRVVFFTGTTDATLRARAERLGPVVLKGETMATLLYVVEASLRDSEVVATAVGCGDSKRREGSGPPPGLATRQRRPR